MITGRAGVCSLIPEGQVKILLKILRIGHSGLFCIQPCSSAHTESAFVSCLAVGTGIYASVYSFVENCETSLQGMNGCGHLSTFLQHLPWLSRGACVDVNGEDVNLTRA